MPDLADGESTEMAGSGAKPYTLKNTGGVYSCSCPAWRNQSIAIERRTCKHLRKLRGDSAETERIGSALPQKPAESSDGEGAEPPLLLAESWDNAADLSGWWMSEKLDGVRAYWDGKRFLSRQGNIFHAPDWFVSGLPGEPLDGELWMDRMAFQRTVSIVRRQDKSDHWKQIRFLVFDAPSAGGGFEDRLSAVQRLIGRMDSTHFQPHEHVLCRGEDHLRNELQRVESLGGEGLMLRQPGSAYVVGRSATLLKVKSFKDAEAIVIGHLPGSGRHRGRLGALQVKLPDGTEFAVGTGLSDKDRESPPAIGAVITFRYQELTDGGVPRFPSFQRMRSDSPSASSEGAPSTESAPSRERKRRSAGLTAAESTPVAASVPTTLGTAQPSASDGQRRRFEFVGGNSQKFWEVQCVGSDLTTWWGRIGSSGQSKTKSFRDASAAEAAYQKLISEKTKEGYVEVPGIG